MDVMEHTLERVVERIGTTYYGKYRATVTDVDDPQNLCHLRASLQSPLDGQEVWATPALPFAGDGHGIVMLPKVGDNVWIEFEAGKLDAPIWSGGWWDSAHQRPDPQGAKIRVIVSDNGNQVVLDDEKDEVKLVHNGGPEIKITASEIVLTVGSCELKISATDISLNNGLIKVGLAGVSLVNGAMAFGVPP